MGCGALGFVCFDVIKPCVFLAFFFFFFINFPILPPPLQDPLPIPSQLFTPPAQEKLQLTRYIGWFVGVARRKLLPSQSC